MMPRQKLSTRYFPRWLNNGAIYRRHSEFAPTDSSVKRRGHAVLKVRTEPIKPYQVDPEAVMELTRDLARRHGEPVSWSGLLMNHPGLNRPKLKFGIGSHFYTLILPTTVAPLPTSGIIFASQGG